MKISLDQPILVKLWVVASALWVAGYIFGESLDGLMFQELGEVIPMTLLPPLLPPLILAGAVRVMADCCRP